MNIYKLYLINNDYVPPYTINTDFSSCDWHVTIGEYKHNEAKGSWDEKMRERTSSKDSWLVNLKTVKK